MDNDFDLEIDDDGEDLQKDKYLTFRISGEGYGLEIRHVIEIIGIQKITEVPDMPAYVKGMINLRGTVIPIIDVRARFGLDPKEYDNRTCIVVVTLNETVVGLIVDEVSEVVNILENNMEPPPKVSRGPNSRFIQGLGKVEESVRLILEVKKLLYDEEPAEEALAEN
ncbi:MAG: purine-binding chemotaxis protein CheW [Nitrospinae bacterium]|nr:purine-binding chemotaxis protein CheW [Nitrospinota bacterium]